MLAIITASVYTSATRKRCLTSPKAAMRLDAKIAAPAGRWLGDLKIADYVPAASSAPGMKGAAVLSPPQYRRPPPRPPRGQGQFAGTNVLYAMKLGVTPLGTMAHEYLQAWLYLGRPGDSQVFGFETVGQGIPLGDLGIA